MQELDKAAMGRRIRQIRLREGLRQWELARLLGTTQSAVHKYEHGVVPEPRRLVELARIGGTSIEWVLTGRHWENGSNEQQRLPADVLETARSLREIVEDDGPGLDEALRITQDAVKALNGNGGAPVHAPDLRTLTSALANHGPQTLKVLEAAWRIQSAVLQRVAIDAGSRLEASLDATQSETRENEGAS